MSNYYFKFMVDHIYKEKQDFVSLYSVSSHKKLINSYSSRHYNNIFVSLSSKDTYKFMSRSSIFRDKYYNIRLNNQISYFTKCQLYYSTMLYYNKLYKKYKGYLRSYKKSLFYCKGYMYKWIMYLNKLIKIKKKLRFIKSSCVTVDISYNIFNIERILKISYIRYMI